MSTIGYGKESITLYRFYAKPMQDLSQIPESEFTGTDNTLLGVEVSVEIFGDNFLSAYTEGDNSQVIATDTMKNFVLEESVSFEGSTMEGLLHFLAQRFIETYPQIAILELTGKKQPFKAARVPTEDGNGFTDSDILFSRSHDNYGFAVLKFERVDDRAKLVSHECGYLDMQLIKVTGSSFAGFEQDKYTTLPPMEDRPLFIFLDVYWKYVDPTKIIGQDLSAYIAPEQVRDFVQFVFYDFVSKSIQQLVYEMGERILKRFPQMQSVSFRAENRLWDLAFESEDNRQVKVYCDPPAPYGQIKLTLNRDDI